MSFLKENSGSRKYGFANEIPTSVSSAVYETDYITENATGKIVKTVINNNYKYLLISATKADDFTTLKVQERISSD